MSQWFLHVGLFAVLVVTTRDAWFVGASRWYGVSFPFAGPLLPIQYFVKRRHHWACSACLCETKYWPGGRVGIIWLQASRFLFAWLLKFPISVGSACNRLLDDNNVFGAAVFNLECSTLFTVACGAIQTFQLLLFFAETFAELFGHFRSIWLLSLASCCCSGRQVGYRSQLWAMALFALEFSDVFVRNQCEWYSSCEAVASSKFEVPPGPSLNFWVRGGYRHPAHALVTRVFNGVSMSPMGLLRAASFLCRWCVHHSRTATACGRVRYNILLVAQATNL